MKNPKGVEIGKGTVGVRSFGKGGGARVQELARRGDCVVKCER